MLGAFLDDSGTHASSTVTTIGGLLGTEAQWEVFVHAWNARLAKPIAGRQPLRSFHLSHCRNGQGEFLDYTLAERDHINYLFRRIVLDVGLVTVAAAVNRIAWNELVTGQVDLGDPLDLCFFKCLEGILRFIRRDKPDEKVCLFFDEGIKQVIGPFSAFCEMDKVTYPEVDRILFAPVTAEPPLQGADMIAYETYKFAQQWFEHGEAATANAHFREYLKRPLSMGLVFDYDQIAEMVERAKAGPPVGWKP
jgi:hypothetical protein